MEGDQSMGLSFLASAWLDALFSSLAFQSQVSLPLRQQNRPQGRKSLSVHLETR
jgi:hypothetical protein